MRDDEVIAAADERYQDGVYGTLYIKNIRKVKKINFQTDLISVINFRFILEFYCALLI